MVESLLAMLVLIIMSVLIYRTSNAYKTNMQDILLPLPLLILPLPMHWPSPFLATVFLRPWPWPWEGEEGSKGGKGKGKEKKSKEKKGKGKGKSKGKDQRGKKRKAGPGFHLDGVQFQGKVVTKKGDWGGSFCMACIEVAKKPLAACVANEIVSFWRACD